MSNGRTEADRQLGRLFRLGPSEGCPMSSFGNNPWWGSRQEAIAIPSPNPARGTARSRGGGAAPGLNPPGPIPGATAPSAAPRPAPRAGPGSGSEGALGRWDSPGRTEPRVACEASPESLAADLVANPLARPSRMSSSPWLGPPDSARSEAAPSI